MDEDIVIPIAGMIMVIVLALGIPLVIAHVRRMGRRETGPESFTDERLDRIEHAIDAMAVEVERIAEGQRFVTKLLSDRVAEPAQLPGARQSARGEGSR